MILSSRPTPPVIDDHLFDEVLMSLAEMQVDLLDLDGDELNDARQDMVIALDTVIDFIGELRP